MSSRTQKPRPWVPSTRSFSRGWMTMSCTGTVGRLLPSGSQLAPPDSLLQQKDIVLDDDNLLSSTVERKNVVEDLEAALFDQLVRRLQRI